MGKRKVNLVGSRFGRLVVIAEAEKLSEKNPRWECQCDCGQKTIAQGGALKSGRNKSCGCLQKEVATKHGMEGSLTYTTWAQMKARCLNAKHRSYNDYGGRGIFVCDRWMEFQNFYADMGEKPEGLSLDRIDNEKGYSPENCRWTTMKVQNRNKRNTVYIEFRGENKSRSDWAMEYGISEISLKSRLNLGWDIEKALTTPIDKRKSTKRKLSKPGS